MSLKPKQPAAARRRTLPLEQPAPSLAASAQPQDLRLSGSLDRVDEDGTIEGWCWSEDEPDTARLVAVLLDGQEVARFASDQERDDLRKAGVGNGQHGFLFCLDPELMLPGRTAEVALRDVNTGRLLGATRSVRWPSGPADDTPAVAEAPQTPTGLQGNLDRVSRDGWVSGWCWYPDRPAMHVELSVFVDDQPVGTMVAANYRPDLQQAGIGDGSHGFSFALPYSALADKGTLCVAVRETATGRNLSDPITVRLGRLATAEERIQDLERQLRLMRGQVEEITRASAGRDEGRAARELFATVATFFQQLAQSRPGEDLQALGAGALGGAGLAGALDDIVTRLAPITLALPQQPDATICIAATAGITAIHACIAAVQAAGIDAVADIVLLDDGMFGPEPALLPSVVRNLRYLRLPGGDGLSAGRNDVAGHARGGLMVFLAPQVRLTRGWLEEIIATFALEPDAAVVAGRLLREDGLLEQTGLLAGDDGRLRDPGHLAPAETGQYRVLRRVDAVAGQGFAVRAAALREVGGFSPLYRRFGHAVADLCVRLRARGRGILVQPLATAIWIDPGGGIADGAPPDLDLPDEETLRLRESFRREGWPPGPAAARWIGHALVIDDDLPRPDRDAGSIAVAEQLQVLRRLGYRVTFCPVHAEALNAAEVDGMLRRGIEVASPPHYGSVTHYLQDEGTGLDLVHVYRYTNAAMLLERIRELAPHAKLVLATADLHFLREQRRAELSGGPLPDAARADELRCIRAADATIVTSDYELSVLQAEPDPGRLVLLRWIVRPVPSPHGFAARRDICFVGNFRHPPNLDGMQWFVAEVLPLLRAAAPDLRLRIAGSDMPQAVRDLASDAVEVLGWVEDLAGLFGAVRLSVAPLRFGAGFKGKVAMSLAHGLPVVGSSISLEGTGLAPGDGVAVADDADRFAAEILRLYGDAALWQAQSQRGREQVAALFSPEAAEAVWRRLLGDLDLPTRG